MYTLLAAKYLYQTMCWPQILFKSNAGLLRFLSVCYCGDLRKQFSSTQEKLCRIHCSLSSQHKLLYGEQLQSEPYDGILVGTY